MLSFEVITSKESFTADRLPVYHVIFLLMIIIVGLFCLFPNVEGKYVVGGSYTVISQTTNQTQLVNATLKIYTCNGENLVEGTLKPYVMLIDSNGSKVFNGYCYSCSLTNMEAGEYTLKVTWRGVLVYQSYINLDENSSEIKVYTNTTRVTISALDDSENKFNDNIEVKMSISGKTFVFNVEETHILPTGQYQVEATYTWNGVVETKVSDIYDIGCSASRLLIRFPVASEVTISFQKRDGSSVRGLDGKAVLYTEKEEKVVSISFSNTDVMHLKDIPYGTYIVKVFLGNNILTTKTVNVDESSPREIVVQLSILPSVTVFVKNLDKLPIVNTEIKISNPIGEEVNIYTDNSGRIVLTDVVEGQYSFTIKWYGIDIRVENYIGENSLTIVFPLKNVELKIRPKGSASLPKGLEVKVLFSLSGIIIKEGKLNSETPEWVLDLGMMWVEGRYEISVEYDEFSWKYVVNKISSSQVEISVPVYDAVVRLYNIQEEPLSGCQVAVSYGRRQLNFTVENGVIYLKHVPETDIKLTVFCNSIPVYDGVLTTNDLKEKKIDIKTSVADIKVHIEGWFSRPLLGAVVNLTVVSSGKTVIYTAKTDSSGNAIFNNVPCPPGSSISAVVVYGGLVSKINVEPSSENKVFLDIFIDTPFLKLSLYQSIILIAALIVAVVVAFLFYRKYKYVKEVEELLVYEEEIIEEGEEEKSSLIEKIKDFIKELKGEKEEEEGWELFG